MKNYLILIFLFFSTSIALASKLVEVKVLDKDHLMIYIRDGEVIYKDDATGASAYSGHDYAPGDDKLLVYGQELSVQQVPLLKNWKITSKKDKNYKKEGLHPSQVFRKSKVNNATHDWEYKLDHWVFIRLQKPLQQGDSYTLTLDESLNLDQEKITFTYDIFNSMSEAIHVNIIGYYPESAVKSADLYYWLGDGGARDYSDFEGNQVWLQDVNTGQKYKTGKVEFWKKASESRFEAERRNYTGSDVWNIDFTKFTKPGTYRLVVEGVGCSQPFEISRDVYFEPYKTSLRGFYYMRIGEDQMDMEPVPRRPLFIPGENPEGFTVYLTDLDPFDPEWQEIPGDTWDEPHFKPARESEFWKRRLPGNPTNPHAYGGHSDALDWDRHLGHVSNIYDLLLPYYLSQGKLDDDNLQIAESGNGIPDLIDEARNEVDLWLRLRDGEAYAHGLTNPTREKIYMFQAGTTTMAAWANAANCAMLAECLSIHGDKKLADYYRDEAIKAFEFAGRQNDQQLDDIQSVGDAEMRGRDFKMMAAAFLYNLTGDTRWEKIVAEESVVNNGVTAIEKRRSWLQTWGTAAYLLTNQKVNYPEVRENMHKAVLKQAEEDHLQYMQLRPSRRTSNNNYWQTAQNLHFVVIAHAITQKPEQKKMLEKAMLLDADWSLGRNPSNMVEMTGLGARNVVNCYTSGRNDGTPGLHPGHTPYHNLDPWGTSHNGHNPRWFSDKGYPAWEAGWPHQEAHFNSRYSWSNAEFTPRQTMRGKMVLYAYLQHIFSGEKSKSKL